jgi:hypothetical protein
MTDSRITDITNRRTFIVVAGALAAATVATGLAIMADPVCHATRDPIHAAIAAQVAALSAFDIAARDCELNIDGLRSLEEQTVVSRTAYRLFRVSVGAAIDVAGIVPTTEAGRRVLAAHLQVDRYRAEVENGRRLNDHAARTGGSWSTGCDGV